MAGGVERCVILPFGGSTGGRERKGRGREGKKGGRGEIRGIGGKRGVSISLPATLPLILYLLSRVPRWGVGSVNKPRSCDAISISVEGREGGGVVD